MKGFLAKNPYLCTLCVSNTMFENLSERLERSFKIMKGEGKITEINVAETVKDIRKALLDNDSSISEKLESIVILSTFCKKFF